MPAADDRVVFGDDRRYAHASRFLITGADAGGGPHVIVRFDNDNNGTFETIADSFYAFAPLSPGAPLFSGGVRVATGDFDGDGNDELVTAMGPGGSFVRIWRMTGSGRVAELLEQFAPYGGFNGGIFVATGDFDGDGRDELVTAPDAGGGPHIKVWKDVDRDGQFSDDPLMGSFFAYFAAFSGGVRIAVGNVDNLGGDDLITAPGPGGGSHVKVLSFNGATFVSIEEFFAYDPAFMGGIYLAAGSIEGAGGNGAEIITSPGAGGGPHMRIFTDTNADGHVSDNPLFDEFFSYAPAFTGGVRVAAGDTDNSGFFVEVVTIPGPGGGPHVRVFDDNADAGAKISDNATDDEFMGFDPGWGGGGFVAVGRYTASAFAYPAFPVSIPDAATTNVVMCVPPGTGTIRDLDVGLGIMHTFDGDLRGDPHALVDRDVPAAVRRRRRHQRGLLHPAERRSGHRHRHRHQSKTRRCHLRAVQPARGRRVECIRWPGCRRLLVADDHRRCRRRHRDAVGFHPVHYVLRHARRTAALRG